LFLIQLAALVRARCPIRTIFFRINLLFLILFFSNARYALYGSTPASHFVFQEEAAALHRHSGWRSLTPASNRSCTVGYGGRGNGKYHRHLDHPIMAPRIRQNERPTEPKKPPQDPTPIALGKQTRNTDARYGIGAIFWYASSRAVFAFRFCCRRPAGRLLRRVERYPPETLCYAYARRHVLTESSRMLWLMTIISDVFRFCSPRWSVVYLSSSHRSLTMRHLHQWQGNAVQALPIDC